MGPLAIPLCTAPFAVQHFTHCNLNPDWYGDGVTRSSLNRPSLDLRCYSALSRWLFAALATLFNRVDLPLFETLCSEFGRSQIRGDRL